jgi:inosine-uridine nucleoside N-ribohydrolase
MTGDIILGILTEGLRKKLQRVIIDTDPGIDDAAAILMALASPELSVEAVTTVFGNGSVDMCTANARRVLLAAGRTDIPVYKGAAKPLVRPPNPNWALHIHGNDALGETGFPLPDESTPANGTRHAALELVERVMASPEELTIVALGRLTNVALALSLEPRFAQSVARIVVMGGAVYVPGNVSPVASANLYEDPESAAIVYSSGASLVQVGLDVCNKVHISQSQLEQIKQAGTPTTRLLSAATPSLQRSYVERGLLEEGGGVRYNDLPAITFMVDPNLFGCSEMFVEIETHISTARGQTVAHQIGSDARLPNATVCLEVDGERAAALFTERIIGYRAP